jgi:hypothetical protein
MGANHVCRITVLLAEDCLFFKALISGFGGCLSRDLERAQSIHPAHPLSLHGLIRLPIVLPFWPNEGPCSLVSILHLSEGAVVDMMKME